MTSAISPRSGESAAGDSPGTFVEAGGLSVGAFMAPKTFPRGAGSASAATMPLWVAGLFSIVLSTDALYREEFADDVGPQLRQALAVRCVYRTARRRAST